MLKYPIIIRYLTKLYIKQVLLTSGVIICILFITNAFDTLQKFKSVELSPQDFWQLIILKIPYLFCEVSSLCSFIATVLFLRNITKQNELIIILSNGVSLWKLFLIPSIVIFSIGIIMILTLSPLGTYGLKEYEKVESRVTEAPYLNSIILQSGIFFFEKFADTNRIIQTKSININKKELLDTTILLIDSKNNLLKRIDAPKATICQGSFILDKPTITLTESSQQKKSLKLLTNLSINNLVQTFTPPEMINIWNMKSTIDKFSRSGLVTLKYQIYYYRQLYRPLFMLAMSLIACWFISLNNRDNAASKMLAMALALGIITYFFIEITLRILAYSGIPPMFAVLLPILFITLLSNFVILHFQEA